MSGLLWNSVMIWTFHNTVLMSSIGLGSELVFLLLLLAALLHNFSAASMNTTAFVLFSTWPFKTQREIPSTSNKLSQNLQQRQSIRESDPGRPEAQCVCVCVCRERERVRVLSCLCAEGKGYSSQALKSLRGLYMSVHLKRGSFFYLSFSLSSPILPAGQLFFSFCLCLFPSFLSLWVLLQ